MMRLIASIVLEVLANAVGLLAASWILAPAFSIDAIGFITVVAIFSAVRFILAPLITQLSMRHARMLVGGVSLVTILVSFFVTSLLTNHLAISGLSTWVLATLIVWVFGVIAMLLLPMVIFKKTLAAARAGRPPSSLG
jgi:putative membrane protein